MYTNLFIQITNKKKKETMHCKIRLDYKCVNRVN